MRVPVLLVVASLVACASEDPQGASSSQDTGGPPPVTSGAPSSKPSATVPTPARAHPWAGTWSGRFVASRGRVEVPPGVAYETWATAPSSGEGESRGGLEITIDDLGGVRGRGDGMPGEFTLRGGVERDVVRAGIVPSATGVTRYTGVFLARPQEEATTTGVKALRAEIRVSDGRGVRVRTATVVLRRGQLPPRAEGNVDVTDSPTAPQEGERPGASSPPPTASGSASARPTSGNSD